MGTHRHDLVVERATRVAPHGAVRGFERGVVAPTKTLARELAPHQITVNNIPPSSIDTPMLRDSQDVGNLPSNDTMRR